MSAEIHHAVYAQRLGKWLSDSISLLADFPDLVSIRDMSNDPTRSHFIIRVAPSDIPKVLGLKGSYLTAMRALLFAFSGHSKHSVSIHLQTERRPNIQWQPSPAASSRSASRKSLPSLT